MRIRSSPVSGPGTGHDAVVFHADQQPARGLTIPVGEAYDSLHQLIV